jgi:Putative DNA-binding domain
MPPTADLYSATASEVDYELVKAFVLNAEEADLFSESLTFEAKEKRSGSNVAEAVAALSNTDGGIVLVGVKDKDAAGEARLVGVPKSEHDALASSLHAVIPQAMPDIIPVAMPDGQRLILVLRVNADEVPHPVMISGKVLFRIPGHSVPADRQRVLDLVARDQAAPGAERGRMSVLRPPWHPSEMGIWPEDKDPRPRTGALRVVGGLELPRRILNRPWLDSAARQAALDALNNSPLRQSPDWFLTPWDTKDARATHLRFLAGEVPQGAYRVQSAAYLRLAGRRLSMLVGFRWTDGAGFGDAMRMEHFHHALLGSMITIAFTCKHVARAADAAEPSDPLAWEAWLQPGTDLSVTDVISFGGLHRDSTDDPQTGHFPEARAAGTDVEDLDELARDWLTYWLLDLGTRDFEKWIASWDRPEFLRMPDLALSAIGRKRLALRNLEKK